MHWLPTNYCCRWCLLISYTWWAFFFPKKPIFGNSLLFFFLSPSLSLFVKIPLVFVNDSVWEKNQQLLTSATSIFLTKIDHWIWIALKLHAAHCEYAWWQALIFLQLTVVHSLFSHSIFFHICRLFVMAPFMEVTNFLILKFWLNKSIELWHVAERATFSLIKYI